MSLGLSNIKFGTQQLPFSSLIPPFPAGSADNGLSVDPVTGLIVLGNDVGGSLAALLSNREIITNGFSIALQEDNLFLQKNELNAFGITIQNITDTTAVLLTAALGAATVGAFSDNAAIIPFFGVGNASINTDMYLKGRNNGLAITNATDQTLAVFEALTFLTQLGDVDGSVNGNRFTIDDAAGTFTIENTGLNARVVINGVNGFTGTVAPVNTITVDGGIVTNVA